jgi:hypothetical protein
MARRASTDRSPGRRRPRVRSVLLGTLALLVVVGFLARRTGIGPGGADGFDPLRHQDLPRIEAAEAAHRVGEQAAVCGVVVNATFARETRGQPTFLNLDRPFPDQVFDAVIWGRNRARFPGPPELAYPGRGICVLGRITTHRGVPRIEVRRPEQIQLR